MGSFFSIFFQNSNHLLFWIWRRKDQKREKMGSFSFWFFSKFKLSTVLNLKTFKNFLKSRRIHYNQSGCGLGKKGLLAGGFSDRVSGEPCLVKKNFGKKIQFQFEKKLFFNHITVLKSFMRWKKVIFPQNNCQLHFFFAIRIWLG